MARAGRSEQVADLIRRNGALIPRGLGRAYGDAALNPQLTLSMLALDRMSAFDADTGLLTCEAGVTLADILKVFAPRGWFPAVVPGTKLVTVGGMIAADVHGKNHHRDGAFGAQVQSLRLALADGALRRCSRMEHSDLFNATVGGMGLTGVILEASFRLKPIETAFLQVETLAAKDLEETLALFEDSADWPYSVAWLDCLARGAKLGRSLLTRAAFMASGELPRPLVQAPLRPAAKRLLTVPLDAPALLLNRASIGTFNELFYQHGRMRQGARPMHFDPYFFPLDRIDAWNRLYGRRGFVQYQCVLPKAESPAALAALLARVSASGRGSFLAVLKLLGPAGEGPLSFPLPGYTLSLDFPMRDGTLDLLDALDGITHECGGRVYLAKDACCAPERLRRGYPRLDAFAEVRAQAAGADGKFASELSRRLRL